MNLSQLENTLSLFDGLVNQVLPHPGDVNRPPLSITDHDDRYVIECDLPGVPLDAISLEVQDGILEISGERPQRELPEGTQLTVDERGWSRFCRRVRLDKTVDSSAVSADYVDGVLVVDAPRRSETLPRTIEIRKSADG